MKKYYENSEPGELELSSISRISSSSSTSLIIVCSEVRATLILKHCGSTPAHQSNMHLHHSTNTKEQ